MLPHDLRLYNYGETLVGPLRGAGGTTRDRGSGDVITSDMRFQKSGPRR